MTLTYVDGDHATRGKTTAHSDVVCGRFARIVPNEIIVQEVSFASDNPAFAGVMTIAWSLRDAPEGTEVTITCADAPAGIAPRDHEEGFRSSLENLARFAEDS